MRKNIVNHIFKGANQKESLIDLAVPENFNGSLILFTHGFNGFKDWGGMNLIAEEFAKKGMPFIKFNFSHNGGTVENPIDFPDLEAFGQNNFTTELNDLEDIINWIANNSKFKDEMDSTNITLIGHSRGGGIVTLKASENNKISKIISWAGVSDFGARFPRDEKILQYWEKEGVSYIENSRTKQQMPHYFQFYEDFIKNESRLTIQSAAKNLNIPFLIIHGDADTSVSIDEAKNLYQWHPNSTLEVIKGANHVFGASHPWNANYLPKHLQKVIDLIKSFNK